MTSPPLVCPACRHVEAGALRMRTLAPRDDGLLACDCGAGQPVVDGIPVSFRALDAYLSQEASALLRRDDLPPAVDALIAAHATAPIARDTSTVAT